jgi:hypothetical protein
MNERRSAPSWLVGFFATEDFGFTKRIVIFTVVC